MHLNEKDIKQLIVEALAHQWGLAHGDENGVLTMTSLDAEHRKEHTKKLLTAMLVTLVAIFASYISKYILVLICLPIIGTTFWKVYKMEYPGTDRWYTFMLRWKAAIKDIHLHPRFQQIVDHVFRWQSVAPTREYLREVVRKHSNFQELFDSVNIEFDESDYVPNGGEVG